MYGDLKGTVAADWHKSKFDLNDFAAKNGIDLTDYHPVGIEVDVVESHLGEIHEGIVFVIATKKAVVGETYDEVAEYYHTHNETFPVSRFQIECTFADLLRLWKRFAFTVYSGYRDLTNYEVVQDLDLRKS